MARFGRSAGRAWRLGDRDPRLVRRNPGGEVLEGGVQRARDRGVAGAAELALEVALELEHVREVVGAGELERAIDRVGDGLVDDLGAERAAERGGHLGARRVLAGDSQRLADPPRALAED